MPSGLLFQLRLNRPTGFCGPGAPVADVGVAARWAIPVRNSSSYSTHRSVNIADDESSEESIGEETDRRRAVVKSIDLGRPPTGPGLKQGMSVEALVEGGCLTALGDFVGDFHGVDSESLVMYRSKFLQYERVGLFWKGTRMSCLARWDSRSRSLACQSTAQRPPGGLLTTELCEQIGRQSIKTLGNSTSEKIGMRRPVFSLCLL